MSTLLDTNLSSRQKRGKDIPKRGQKEDEQVAGYLPEVSALLAQQKKPLIQLRAKGLIYFVPTVEKSFFRRWPRSVSEGSVLRVCLVNRGENG